MLQEGIIFGTDLILQQGKIIGTDLILQEGIIFGTDLILQQGKIFLRLLRSTGIKEGIFMDISNEVPAFQIR
jgi:hypothetical protein